MKMLVHLCRLSRLIWLALFYGLLLSVGIMENRVEGRDKNLDLKIQNVRGLIGVGVAWWVV